MQRAHEDQQFEQAVIKAAGALPKEHQQTFLSALEEALSNAIRHGNRFDANKKITVSSCVGAEQTAITVADEGEGFDPGAVPDPTVDENLEKPCGRGIMLMRAYMDEVMYNKAGNEVRMVKHRSGGRT